MIGCCCWPPPARPPDERGRTPLRGVLPDTGAAQAPSCRRRRCDAQGGTEESHSFSVCVRSIDKMAADEDLMMHFAGPDSARTGVLKVEKFSNPRHTARVDLEDEESFKRALALDGSRLHRRDIVVRPWDEDEVFAGFSACERRLASESRGDRPKLMLKPRTKEATPFADGRGERPQVAGGIPASGIRSDPYAGATPRRGDAPTRADRDGDWRRRPSPMPPDGEGSSAPSGLLARAAWLCAWCRRRRRGGVPPP